MQRFFTSLIGVLGALALLIAINMWAERSLATVQIDLTQGHIYSVSPGTKQILTGLKDPIILRLYYSPALGAKVSAYDAMADRVREMLRQYAEISGGKVQLQFLDPEPFSDTEDRALAYGLQSVPLNQEGERVFFGLAGTNLVDDERNIPFFQPERERFLEYDLTRLVHELSSPKNPVLGVMSPLQLDGDPRAMMMARQQGRPAAGQPYAAMTALRQGFTVTTIQPDVKTIDPDVQVLLLIHPQNLSDATLYAVDQFVMRGGKLLAMVAPHSEAIGPDPMTGMPPTETASDLRKLLNAWGVVYDPDKIVGDLKGAWRVRSADPASRVQAVEYPPYFAVRDGINHDDPATADLQEINLANAGFLEAKPGTDITFTPLLSSSGQSEIIPAADIRGTPDPSKILSEFKTDGQHRVIAARIRGLLHSAFDKAPDGATEPYRAQTDGPASLVVIADTDMLSDRFWVQSRDFFGQSESTPFADNGAFIANLAGTLAGGDALIGLRARGSTPRPFDLVDDMRRDAEARYRQTEQVLSTHLDETTKKLTDLRGGKDSAGAGNALTLNDAQRAAIEDLKHDMLETRGKLRGVQLELRRDIADLQTWLRLLNIVLVPAVLIVVAVVLGISRRRRMTTARL